MAVPSDITLLEIKTRVDDLSKQGEFPELLRQWLQNRMDREPLNTDALRTTAQFLNHAFADLVFLLSREHNHVPEPFQIEAFEGFEIKALTGLMNQFLATANLRNPQVDISAKMGGGYLGTIAGRGIGNAFADHIQEMMRQLQKLETHYDVVKDSAGSPLGFIRKGLSVEERLQLENALNDQEVL